MVPKLLHWLYRITKLPFSFAITGMKLYRCDSLSSTIVKMYWLEMALDIGGSKQANGLPQVVH